MQEMAFAAQQHTSLLIQGLYVLMMPPLWVAWALLLQQSTTVDVLVGRLAVIPVSCQALQAFEVSSLSRVFMSVEVS